MIVCQCLWKYEEDLDACPACGRPKPTEDNPKKDKYGRYKSLQRRTPLKRNKRPKPISDNKRTSESGETQKEFIERRGRELVEEFGLVCTNCGFDIKYLKYENVSHIKSRGSRPDLSFEDDNTELLCGPVDRMGEPGVKSCHSLWESDKQAFRERGKDK